MTIASLLLITSLVSVEVQRLKELDLQEVGAEALVKIKEEEFRTYVKRFEACVPLESKPFKGKFSAEQSAALLDAKEVADLDDCKHDRCAFNFLKQELLELAALAKGAPRQNYLQDAYAKRSRYELGIDPQRSQLFLRGRDAAFGYCGESPSVERLLNQRPLKDTAFRLSTTKYHPKMRPTTRLSQGIYWKQGYASCYAEALIYSNHYDIDRVEVWSLTPDSFRLQMRHRVDLLNSWFRRLNKEKFRKQAESIVEDQIKEAVECLKNKR